MKIIALYNGEGHILAAVERTVDYSGPLPAPSPGAEVSTFDVPKTHEIAGLEEVCLAFRVDKANSRLVSTS